MSDKWKKIAGAVLLLLVILAGTIGSAGLMLLMLKAIVHRQYVRSILFGLAFMIVIAIVGTVTIFLK